MKHIYITLILSIIFSFGALSQSPVLTMISDGDCSGGTPKVVEVFADGTVDFSLYSLEIQSNGNTTWGSAQNLGGLGIVTNQFAYIYGTSGASSFASEYPSVSSLTIAAGGAVNFNGDDRIRIIEDATGNVIDQFGEEGVDGSGQAWEYKDGFAKRLTLTTPNGTFNEAHWEYNKSALNTLGVCQGGSEPFETIIGLGSFEPEPSIICEDTYGTDVQTACDSYTWIDGETYTESISGGGPTTISASTGLFTSGSTSWPGVLTATTVADGVASQAEQTFTMNVTSLPAGGANFRVFKTTSNGSNYFGNLTAMVLGVNTFTVPAVTFDRLVKFQFSSGEIQFDELSLNGNSVYSSAPTFVLTNSEGCDSIVTLDLTINNSSTVTDVQEACDSYTWIDGVTYTESTSSAGPAATTLSAQTPGLFTSGSSAWPNILTACTTGDGNLGAQQTLVINVTSLPSGGASYSVAKTVENGNYFYSGSTALSLGVNTLNVASVSFDRTVKFRFSSGDVAFDALSLNGSSIYTAEATSAPTVVLTNAAGCDSTVTLDLTIFNSSTSTDVVSACGEYTWIDGVTYTESTSSGEGTTIAAQTPGLFTTTTNATWTHLITACTLTDGNQGEAQSLEINVTNLPSGGANYQVYKTTANGGSNFGTATALSLGLNTINVSAVTFARAVKFRFNSSDVEFDVLSLLSLIHI